MLSPGVGQRQYGTMGAQVVVGDNFEAETNHQLSIIEECISA
jgi:hypothetical protein